MLVDGEEFQLGEEPFMFGRSDRDGVVGLDAGDMGISAVAGSVERLGGVWWVVNRSRKRRLLLELGAGTAPIPLGCGQRFAMSVPRLAVLVPGAIFTHRVEVAVPEGEVARVESDMPPSGTITVGDLVLSERDRDALVALLGGYLEVFPRRLARPRTYQQAAVLLGPPWTKLTVRKQIERLKERLARTGIYFDGPQANYDLADHLIGEGLLGPNDLDRMHRAP